MINRTRCTRRTWLRKSVSEDERAIELPVEREVSKYIGKMWFLWLPVEDDPGSKSLRGYVERNSIAILSNYNKSKPLDPPSPAPQWLGHFSHSERVRRSGLWNQNHVEEACDPTFLDTLDRLASDARRAS